MRTIAILFLITGVHARILTLYNNCSTTIWPGIQGPGTPASGGLTLTSKQSTNITVDDAWTGGRIWARTGCDSNYNCETGFCKNSEQCNGASGTPPLSMAEFSLKAWGGQDFYDVNLINGFNVVIQIIPSGGTGCIPAGGCIIDLNAECPDTLAVKGSSGSNVACKSGCLGFDTDQECCRGSYSSPDACRRTLTDKMFRDACPTSYSYPYDPSSTTFSCQSTATYTIQFC